jgi:hypothetical protein
MMLRRISSRLLPVEKDPNNPISFTENSWARTGFISLDLDTVSFFVRI